MAMHHRRKVSVCRSVPAIHGCAPTCAVRKAVRRKLTASQHVQLRECFQLIDADGSGNIDGQELGNAFKVSAGCLAPTSHKAG